MKTSLTKTTTTMTELEKRQGVSSLMDKVIENGQEFTAKYDERNDSTYLCLNGSPCLALHGDETVKPITRLWRTWAYQVKKFWHATYSPEAVEERKKVQAMFANDPNFQRLQKRWEDIRNPRGRCPYIVAPGRKCVKPTDTATGAYLCPEHLALVLGTETSTVN